MKIKKKGYHVVYLTRNANDGGVDIHTHTFTINMSKFELLKDLLKNKDKIILNIIDLGEVQND